MPEEDGSNSPSRNPDSQSLPQDPRTDLPEQGVMGSQAAARPNEQEEDSEKPTGRVHWINHATFVLSAILAILTAGTLRVYWLQLNQMMVTTQAARESAYAACMSAKIARQTLLEYQAGEADSHSAASGTVAQASAVLRGESGFLSVGTVRQAPVTPPGELPTSLQEAAKTWKSVDLLFAYEDIGKSALRNARIRFTVQLLPHGTEPRLTDRGVYSDIATAGIINPNQPSLTVPNIIDKDNNFVDGKNVSMEDFRSGKVYIASFGRADYDDVFGVHHWQTFCGFFDNFPFDPSHRELRHQKGAAYNQQDSNLSTRYHLTANPRVRFRRLRTSFAQSRQRRIESSIRS